MTKYVVMVRTELWDAFDDSDVVDGYIKEVDG